MSTLEPSRKQIECWIQSGVQGTTIPVTLMRKHGYRGSFSAVASS